MQLNTIRILNIYNTGHLINMKLLTLLNIGFKLIFEN